MANRRKTAPKVPSNGGVMDVAHPGSAGISASATSRPVIIKHPHLSDPMVNDTPREDLLAPAPSHPVKPAKKVVIVPLHSTVTAEPPTVVDIKPVTAATPPLPTEKPSVVEVLKPVIADVIPQTAASQPAEDAPDQKRVAALQHLIDEETYFLPIETVEERRSRRIVMIGLLLTILLALAWYDVALDANLLSNSFNLPHSHFFSIK